MPRHKALTAAGRIRPDTSRAARSDGVIEPCPNYQ